MEEKEQKKVLVPWDEYQGLLKDSEVLKEAREELKKDCKERGTYMEYKIYLPTENLTDISHICSNIPRLSIISKEESLKKAQNEIDRLSKIVKNIKDIAEQHEKTINRLRNRNLLERIFNKWWFGNSVEAPEGIYKID